MPRPWTYSRLRASLARGGKNSCRRNANAKASVAELIRASDRLTPPIAFRVPFQKRLIKRTADQAQGGGFKRIGRIGVRQTGREIGNAFLRGLRRQSGSVELTQRAQMDWKLEYLARPRGQHAMAEWAERGEPAHVIPDLHIIGMEDMRAMKVKQDPGLRIALGMAIACDVVAGRTLGRAALLQPIRAQSQTPKARPRQCEHSRLEDLLKALDLIGRRVVAPRSKDLQRTRSRKLGPGEQRNHAPIPALWALLPESHLAAQQCRLAEQVLLWWWACWLASAELVCSSV